MKKLVRNNNSFMALSKRLPKWMSERKYPLAIGIILSCLYLFQFAFSANFELEMETIATQGYNTQFKVYWANAEQGFSESRSRRLRIGLGRQKIDMTIAGLGRINRLRIDPIDKPGEVKILSLALKQIGYQPILLEAKGLDQLIPLNQIESKKLVIDGLEIITNGQDGNLTLQLSSIKSESLPLVHFVIVFALILCCLLFRNPAGKLVHNHNYVVAGLAIGLILAIVMASITDMLHPDEWVHFEAVKYYKNHWLPPSLDNPEIAGSFSNYGQSRLSSYEIYYPLAGYFTRILDPIRFTTFFSARVFGIILLTFLLLFSAIRSQFRHFTLPLILTPQIWYLYSYLNSETLALTFSLIVAYQVAVSGSTLDRFLNEQKPSYFVVTLLCFGMLGGALLLAKVNFYLFLFFLFTYLVWRQVNGYVTNPKVLWIRIMMIVMIAVSMYGVRMGLDYAANGPDPKAKFNEYVELKAHKMFNPKTPIEERHIYLELKKQGKSLNFVLDDMDWGAKVFVTAFGSYGYTQYFGSDTYHNFMAWLACLLIATMIYYALVKGPPRVHSLILLAAFSAVLLIAAAIWGSWTQNFQAQGRYMTPIVPMISIVYYHIRNYLNPIITASFALSMFVMSVYSFVFVGLVQIEKFSYASGAG